MRKTDKRLRNIPWYGTKASEMDTRALNKDDEAHVAEPEERKASESPVKQIEEDPEKKVFG